MRYLLDTGIASDVVFRRGAARTRVRQAALAGHIIGIGTPVLAEMLYGAENSPSTEDNRAKVRRQTVRWKLWTFDEAAAVEHGRLAALLKHQGRLMQQFDIAIAAIALSLGQCVVVSKDGDLRAVPGLAVEDWSQA